MLCAASGNPDPEITWFKDFLPVDPSASNGRIKQLRSGERGGPGGCGSCKGWEGEGSISGPEPWGLKEDRKAELMCSRGREKGVFGAESVGI